MFMFDSSGLRTIANGEDMIVIFLCLKLSFVGTNERTGSVFFTPVGLGTSRLNT